MRDFFTLYMAMLRGHLGLDSLSGGGGRARRTVVAVLVAIFAAFFFAAEICLFVPLVRAAAEMEYPVLSVEIAVLLAAVPGFLFSFFGVLRGICFAGDIALLAPLPVKRICIFRSKVAFVYTCCFAACAAVLLPAFGVYAHFAGANLMFWLRAALMLFLYPILPLSAATVVAVPVSLLFGRGRTASSFTKYTALVTVPVMDVCLAYIWVRAGSGGENIISFLNANWAQIKAWSIPPFSWASISVCGGGMTSAITILLFAATALVLWLLVGWILRSVFVRRVARALSTPVEKAMK